MSFNPRKVYQYDKTRDADGNEVYRLSRINPYIAISANGGPRVFLCEGQVYSADRKVIPESEWPAWLPEHIDRLTPEGRAKVGFGRAEDIVPRSEPDDSRISELKRELDAAKSQIAELRQGFAKVERPTPLETPATKAPNGADGADSHQGSAW